MHGKDPFVLSIALGKNDRIRSILGLPSLLAMGAAIDLVSGLLSRVELNHKFPLELHPSGKGLPCGASFDHYPPTISPCVSTSITSYDYILYYTSAKGDPHPLCPNTPYNLLHES